MKRDEPLKIIFRELRATDDEAKQRDIVRRLQNLSRFACGDLRDRKNVIKWFSATQHHVRESARLLKEGPWPYYKDHYPLAPGEPILETIRHSRANVGKTFYYRYHDNMGDIKRR
jgi:hypothetical protein